jgi:predicted ATPase
MSLVVDNKEPVKQTTLHSSINGFCYNWLQARRTEKQEDAIMRAVRYLVTECNYGGHVTDDNDRRLLKTLLLNFINRGVAFESGYPISETG